MTRTALLVVGIVVAATVGAGAVAAADVGGVGQDSAPAQVTTPTPNASVQFENQTLVDGTVTVDQANLTDGGFVAVYNEDGAFLGVSEYLEAGAHENVTVAVSQPIDTPDRDRERARDGSGGQARERNRTRTTVLLAVAHRDTNANETFDYLTSNGTEDVPYVDGGIVLDDAYVSPPDRSNSQ